MLLFWVKLFIFLPGKWIIANRCPRVFLPVRSASTFNLLHDPPLRNMLRAPLVLHLDCATFFQIVSKYYMYYE